MISRRPLACIALFGMAAAVICAAPIYSESFDYGGTTAALTSVSSWTSTATFNLYAHDGGLNVAGMTGETGGAWFSDRPGGNLSASLGTTTIDLSTISAGETIWAGAIFDYKTGTAHSLSFNGGSVSALGFWISAGGNVSVSASNNGSGNTSTNTGIDAATGTYFLPLPPNLWVKSIPNRSEAT